MQHLFWALPWLQKINLVKSDAPELSWALLDICDCQIQSLLLGLLLPNQIHHMVNGINCCVWLTYDTQKTSQLAWSGMIVCCQSYRGYFKHILCLIPFSPLSSVFDEFTEFDFSKSWLLSVFTLCQDKPDWTKISFIHSEIWT